MNTKSLVLLAGLMTATATTLAWAARNNDGTDNPAGASAIDSSQSVAQTAIAPVESVIALARTAQPGTIIEVELDREGGKEIYEVKVIDTQGKVRKLAYDAASLQPLLEGRNN